MRGFIILIGALLAFVLTAHAGAAENGMYRPGNAYYSQLSASPDQCAAMCRGDGTCQSWNFVKIRPSDTRGVCELNAQQAAPVPSPISISGANIPTQVTARLIPSGTRTVRVGSIPTPQSRQTVRVGNVPEQKPATRRVVKKTPPPVRQTPTQAAYRQPVPAPSTDRKPSFRHSLDNVPTPRQQAAAPRTPKDFHTERLKRLIATQAQASEQTAEAAIAGAPVPPRRPNPGLPANAPAETVQQSLFGSLYDDVKAPKALGPEDIPQDTDAPIATVASVPTQKVTVDNLMAGAPPAN